MTLRESILELFRLKGVFKNHCATLEKRAFVARCLSAADKSVRLFAAAVVLAEHATYFEQPAKAAVQEAIAQQRVDGSFVKSIFWEAIACNPSDWWNTDALLDLVEKHLAEANPSPNIPGILGRIAATGHPRATMVLQSFKHNFPCP